MKITKKRIAAFSMVELLTVIAIMSIMMGLVVSTGMGTRPAGSRQGAISQIMAGLEEARMSAIEKNTTVYFGIADTSHPDDEKQLRGYILFRAQTITEKAASKTEDMIPLTRWEKLPQGFYFDADKFQDMTVEMPGKGLPGDPQNVRAIEFGSLGQVTGLGADVVPQLTVTEAVYQPSSKILTRKSGEAGDFIVKIYRLTGRLQLTQNQP